MMKICGVKFDKKYNTDELLDIIESYRKENDIFIQLFNHEKVIGKEHLIWAYDKAEEMMEQETNRADSLEIETLLWASAEWQIKSAIRKMGVPDNSDKAALLIEREMDIFLDEMDWEREDDLLNPSLEKLKRFGVDEKEIESVTEPYDLVFEKMSTSIL